MEKAQFIFTSPFEVRIERKGDYEEVYLDGFISTTDCDIVNDIVTKNCLESFKNQIIARNIKLDFEHEAFRGDSQEEMEINKSRNPVGRMMEATVEEIGKNRWGLRVKSMLNRFHKRFEEVKGSIMNKCLDAYSIAFIPTKTVHKEINGKSVRLLDDSVLLNVALTGNPINTSANNMDIFMKAINSLEDYKNEKKANPEVEGQLVVKSKIEKKENVLFAVLDKWLNKKELSKTEYGLIYQAGKIALRTDNERNLFNEILDKESKDIVWKDYDLLNSLLNIQILPEKELVEERAIKSQTHESDLTKLNKKEEKMSEDNEKQTETQPEGQETGQEAEGQEAQSENAEVKSLSQEVKSLNERISKLTDEVSELKAKLKAPVRKSTVTQQDKSEQFKDAEAKSLNPLDVIA